MPCHIVGGPPGDEKVPGGLGPPRVSPDAKGSVRGCTRIHLTGVCGTGWGVAGETRARCG